MSVNIQKLDVPASALGEGPIWSEREQCLYYVDITQKRLQAYWPTTAKYRYWQFEKFVGSLAECKSGGLLVALTDEVVWFDPARGLASLEPVATLEADRPKNRLNDGKADPWGRFWVGSMEIEEEDSNGRLWCITPEGQVSQHRDRVGVSNSLAFDRERRRVYFADSIAGAIYQSSLDAGNLPIEWQVFATVEQGSPDGSTLDREGYLWNAQWQGWKIVRYAPDGSVDRVVEMPVSRPSCCVFGGSDYRTLFVTSASHRMSEQEHAADPLAGSLFAIELEAPLGLSGDLFGR